MISNGRHFPPEALCAYRGFEMLARFGLPETILFGTKMGVRSEFSFSALRSVEKRGAMSYRDNGELVRIGELALVYAFLGFQNGSRMPVLLDRENGSLWIDEQMHPENKPYLVFLNSSCKTFERVMELTESLRTSDEVLTHDLDTISADLYRIDSSIFEGRSNISFWAGFLRDLTMR